MEPDRQRYRVHLVQVGLAGNVTAVVTRTPDRGDTEAADTWDVTTSATLEEFLQRPNYEFPQDTPIVRLDLTDDIAFWKHLREGPHLQGALPLGTVVAARSSEHCRYANESAAELRGWSVAADVYGRLAGQAGLVVEHLAMRRADRD